MKWGNIIDMTQLEIRNQRIHVLASAPGSPVTGQIYYDSALNTARQWNGSAWIAFDPAQAGAGVIPNTALTTNPLARANHTGTQLASTISNFTATVITSTLDTMAAPVASVSMNSQKITNLATPTLSTDAVTKAYADASAAGIDAKAFCRVASTANVTVSNPATAVFDGVTLTSGVDSILLKNQTAGAENGIYIFNGSASALTRRFDCNSATNYTPASFTFISEGTVNATTQWKVSTSGTFVIGTTSITWVQWGAGSAYTNGNGLSLTGNSFAVNNANGILADGTSTRVDPAVVTRKFAQTIGDGSTTAFTLTHNLNTLDVEITVRLVSTGEQVQVDNAATGVNTATVTFAVAPATNTYRAIVQG